MTYAMAWKTESDIFMAADSVITTTSDFPLELISEKTSFGQDSFLEEDQSKAVEERVIKLILKKNIGLTFAGSYTLAIRVASTFYRKINEKLNPLEALKEAIFLNSPFPKDRDLQIAVGYYDKGPQLLFFDSTKGEEIITDTNLVQLGNPLLFHKKLTEDWIDFISKDNPSNPVRHLVSMLAVFQSYNLFSPQIERGIGGAFSGLYITKTGAQWQPDILYMEYGGKNENLVSTCFRHDFLVINSPVLGQSRALGTYLPPASQSLLMEQANKAKDKGKMMHSRMEFEYVVILGVEHVTLTVIEMQRNRRHRSLWFEPIKNAKGSGSSICIFSELRKLINTPGAGLSVIPYVKPIIKTIPKDRTIQREM